MDALGRLSAGLKLKDVNLGGVWKALTAPMGVFSKRKPHLPHFHVLFVYPIVSVTVASSLVVDEADSAVHAVYLLLTYSNVDYSFPYHHHLMIIIR